MLPILPHHDKVAISFSGGIDSTVLAYWVRKQRPDIGIMLLAVYYSQANWLPTQNLMHKHSLKLNCYKDSVDICIPCHDGSEPPLCRDGYKPPEKYPIGQPYPTEERSYDYALLDGRNAFIYLSMFSYCSYHEFPVLLTGHQYDPEEWDHIDCYKHRTEDFSPMFLDRMNLLQEVGFRNRVRLEAPFSTFRLGKKEIIKLGLELGIDIKNDTYSCQFYPECGRCENCVTREKAFKELGIK